MTHKYEVGELLKVARIVDDLKCQHVGLIGKVLQQMPQGFTRDEVMYLLTFDATEQNPYLYSHLFYESELERVG